MRKWCGKRKKPAQWRAFQGHLGNDSRALSMLHLFVFCAIVQMVFSMEAAVETTKEMQRLTLWLHFVTAIQALTPSPYCGSEPK